MNRRSLSMLAVAALGLALAAPLAHGEDALALLGMLPPPASGDCSAKGATMQKRAAALAAFEKAYAAAGKQLQQQEQQSLAGAQSGASTDPDAMMKLQAWLTAPGEIVLRERANDLFGPPGDEAHRALAPITAKAEQCDLQDENCTDAQLNAIVEQARPILVKWAGQIARLWPQYIDAVKRDIAWTKRPLPAGVDPHNSEVLMQLYVMRGQALQDVRDAADQANEGWTCIETANMKDAIFNPGGAP